MDPIENLVPSGLDRPVKQKGLPHAIGEHKAT